MDRITRICSIACCAALFLTSALDAKSDDGRGDTDLYWQAQRAELSGQPVDALKSYNKLLKKLPQSNVAVDRLFESAVQQGDFASVLKAARAHQLAESGDAALPLIFFVDAWKRQDWAAAAQASDWLKQRGVFDFMTPILNAWVDAAQGKAATIPSATLRDNGLLAFYANDQLVFLDFANGNITSAQRRLSNFPGFGDDFARHMAMLAAEHLGRKGESEYANSLLAHIGAEAVVFVNKPSAFSGEMALPSLFSRLSEQLQEQGVADQALYFARLSHWLSPDNAYGRMALSRQLAAVGQWTQAKNLLDGIAADRVQASWALSEKARILQREGRSSDALALVQSARVKTPEAMDLMLLEAQQREESGDLAGATAIYRQLVTASDGSGSKNGRQLAYRLLLAAAFEAQNDWPSAKETLEEALKFNGENAQVLNSLGYGLLERREDVKRGFALVAKAHHMAPDSAAITDSLGWGHYLNGEFEQSVPLLEKAVEGAINDATINEHLGDAYWQTGRLVDARYAWRAALLQAESNAATRIAAKVDLGWTDETAAR